MQFCSSTVHCNFEYHHPVMCWEYIDIIASNIPQMKITTVSELLHSTYRGSPTNAGVYLETSLLDFLTTEKFHDLSMTSPKFQQNSRTFQDYPGIFSNASTFQGFPGLVGAMRYSNLTKNGNIKPATSVKTTISYKIFETNYSFHVK